MQPLPSRLHRLVFGRQLTARAPEPAALWKPEGAAEKMRIRGAIAQVRPALEEGKQRMRLEEGPYRDKDGKVKALADEIAKGTNREFMAVMHALHDRILPVNSRRYLPMHFEFDGAPFVLHEPLVRMQQTGPISAGELLASPAEEPEMYGIGVGMKVVPVASEVELAVLAIGVLRRIGYHAYFGYAQPLPGSFELPYYPAIPVLGQESVGLFSIHPEMVWGGPPVCVDMLDDVGMQAYLLAMHGENLAKILQLKMVEGIKGVLERMNAAYLIERMESGELPMGLFDLISLEPRQWLAEQRLWNGEDVTAFARIYDGWEQEAHVDHDIHRMAEPLAEAKMLYSDAHFLPGIIDQILRLLPNHHGRALGSLLADAVGRLGDLEGAIGRGEWPPAKA